MKWKLTLFVLLTLVVAGTFPAAAQDGGKPPPITPQNAAQVKQLARLGRGTINGLAWSRWRRRHQFRAMLAHYRCRQAALPP